MSSLSCSESEKAGGDGFINKTFNGFTDGPSIVQRRRLFLAALSGNKTEISKLIEEGIDVNFMFTQNVIRNKALQIGLGPCNHAQSMEKLLFIPDLLNETSQEEFQNIPFSICVEENEEIFKHLNKEKLRLVYHDIGQSHCQCFKECKTHAHCSNVCQTGFGILHIFASIGLKHMVEWYVKTYNANINLSNSLFQLTPLHMVILHCNAAAMDCLPLLTSLGADINSYTAEKETIMTYASEVEDINLIELIVDLGYQHDGQNLVNYVNPLLVVLSKTGPKPNTTKLIEKLLKAGFKADECCDSYSRHSALTLAVATNNDKAVEVLLASNCNVNSVRNLGHQTQTPLLMAAQHGFKNICNLMLNAGANPNIPAADSNTALIYAVCYDYPDIVKSLLANPLTDANIVTNQGYSALHFAAWDGMDSVVEMLLQKKAKHDEQTSDKNTPLALAAHGNALSVVQMLLSLACNVNNADKDLDTPLMYAAYNNNEEMCKLLLENGADCHAVNKLNTSVLWNASFGDCKEFVKILLQHNVDMDICSVGVDQHAQGADVAPYYDEPHSPVYAALEQGNYEIAKMLIQGGCCLKEFLDMDLDEFFMDQKELWDYLKRRLHSPKTLKQSGRKCIRTIMKGKYFAEKVQQLEIPSSLIDYLALNHFDET